VRPRALVVSVGLALGFAASAPPAEESQETLARPANRPGSSAPSKRPRVPPSAPDIDLLEIRNIFLYADEPGALGVLARRPGGGSVDATREAAPSPSRARLVGLVRRSGRLVAAIAIDGEVLLLGEEGSAGGFTVLEIGEETVRLRGPEGEEETLRLP
jgi:hypothetical protein